MNIVKKELAISGMTCVNCQHRIGQKLSQTPGIKSAKVSYNKGKATITYDTDEISLKSVIAVIESLDYKAAEQGQQTHADADRAVWLLILIIALYVLLQQFGILNLLVPGQLADSKMGYGMLFVVGLLTSVHCIAMCGGLNLSCCLPQKGAAQKAEKNGELDAFLPAFAYNAGRVVSYTLIGFLLGLAGMALGGSGRGGLSPLLQGVLKLAAGIFMVIMGMNMLALFPWLRKFGLRMPKVFAAAVGRQKRKGGGPFLVGLLNGLMPCGPLQSMQIVAFASANPIAGGLSMFFFALGTVPLMLGVGSLVAALGKRFTEAVTRVGAILVTVLGLAMLSQGVSLSGFLTQNQLLCVIIGLSAVGVISLLPPGKTGYRKAAIIAAACAVFLAFGVRYQGGSNAVSAENGNSVAAAGSGAAGEAGSAEGTAQENAPEDQMTDGVQIVSSTLSAGRYPNITVTAGVPVQWVIDAPSGSINGCNYKMLIRDYGIQHTFQEGENVIEFTPTEAGTVTYTCWMGMIRGTIFVTEGGTASSEAVTSSGEIAVSSGEAAAASSEGVGSSGETAGGASSGKQTIGSVTGTLQEEETEIAETDVVQPSAYQIPAEELAVAQKTTASDGSSFQSVEITLTKDGFSPAVVVVEAGVETSWTIINERSEDGESDELLAILYSTTLPLASGENTLYLYPTESFDVSTGDSAFYAYIKVVEDLDDIDADVIRSEAAAYQPYIYPASAFEGVQSYGSCCY